MVKYLGMKRTKSFQKLLILLYAVAVLLFCHHFIFRPIFLDWGAPEAIQKLSLSGDVFTDRTRHTRAVLIEATPDEVWPWLIQIGQDRGGFYSYEWLENIFRADMENVYKIRPQFQRPRQCGDTIWMANKQHYNGQGYQIVAETTPFKSLVMVGGDDYLKILKGQKASGSWAFYLHAEDREKTWLIARSSEGDIPFSNRLLRYFTYEVPHFIMERKMLKSIKYLVEK